MTGHRPISFMIGICFVIMFGCASYKVAVETDPDSEFGRYETFGWLNSSEQVEAFNRIQNTRVSELVHQAVDRILIEKGYEKISQGDPDMIITYYVGVKGPIEVDDQGYTYGKWFEQGKTVDQEGVLIIDLIDNERRVLIRRATGGTIVDDPDKASELIGDMIRKMFDDFPKRQT